MWGKFVAEFRAAPIPKEWKQNGPHPLIPDLTWEDIRGNYYAALDEASEPRSSGQGRVQDLPRPLGQVPVLRRVLP
jgi:hypothetical protein